MDNELCPICMDNSATYFTECNHGYCIGCLSHITRCSMCRKSLLRSQLCIQIKVNVIINPAITNNLRLHFNHPLNELTWLSSVSRY